MEQHQEVNNHSTGGSYGHPPLKPVLCRKLRNRVYVLLAVTAIAVGPSWSLATGTSQLDLSKKYFPVGPRWQQGPKMENLKKLFLLALALTPAYATGRKSLPL